MLDVAGDAALNCTTLPYRSGAYVLRTTVATAGAVLGRDREAVTRAAWDAGSDASESSELLPAPVTSKRHPCPAPILRSSKALTPVPLALSVSEEEGLLD